MSTSVAPSPVSGARKPGAGEGGAEAVATQPALALADPPDPPLSSYAPEDWLAFAVFWALAAIVFLQFFTRYVLNDSVAWTEEIARYLLICCTFVGAAIAARKNSHIFVEFFYVYLGPSFAFALSTLVDLFVIAFYALSVWLSWRVTMIMQYQPMVVIEMPLSIVYAVVTIGFVLMTARAIQVAVRHWRAGESELTRVRTEGRDR